MDEDLTELMQAASRGERDSSERLFELIYRDLLRQARARLARERTYTDLNATALVAPLRVDDAARFHINIVRADVIQHFAGVPAFN